MKRRRRHETYTGFRDLGREPGAAVVNRGAFGAPTFFVNGAVFFGNDQLDFVEAALRKAG